MDASKEQNAGEEKVVKAVVITRGKLMYFALGFFPLRLV